MTVLFWSYAHFDDKHDRKDLAWLHERLTGELLIQTGLELESFWDETGIRLAEDWQARIDDALGKAELMIAIITPLYFRSAYCRAEYEFFHRREQAEETPWRIIPVYYVTTPELESPAGPWARDLARRHRYDWRKLRGQERGKATVRRAIQDLATAIKPLLPDPEPREAAAAEGGRGRTPEQIDYAYLSQTSTQRHIVETLYRLPRRDIALDEFYKHFCKVDPDAVKSTGEMFYRIKDLMHQGLLVMKRMGVKATIIKAAPEVGNVLFDKGRIDT